MTKTTKVRDVNYLALDLEYNSKGGDNGTEDIIQVGLAVGSPHSGVIRKEAFLVKPSDKTIELHPFITQLTGITQEEYDQGAHTWEEVVAHIVEWHKEYEPFCNPVTWGIGDAYDIRKTVKGEGLDFPFFGRRIIDVKHLFLYVEAANGRAMSGGLRSAMGRHKLQFQGKPHRADIDAANTLTFYFHLLKRQATLESTIAELKTL